MGAQAASSHRLHAGHAAQQSVARDRSLATRSRQPNRYSLMSDMDMKPTPTAALTTPAGSSDRNENKTDNAMINGLNGLNGLTPAEPLNLRGFVPTQPPSPQSKIGAIPLAVPVPVPYRERSASFDRSRQSKVEREAKRRSYYPNHVTQV